MLLPPGVPKPTYVDRPDLMETFADTLETFNTDGETLRMEFCVDRLDARSMEHGGKPNATKHPVARIVMPLSTAVEMMNRLNGLFTSMAAQQNKGQSLPGLPSGKPLKN